MAMLLALFVGISLVFSVILLPLIIKFCHKHGLYDKIDARKVHTGKIPRLGGVAIAVPFVVVQRDVKRILAYSSMENIGIMVAGIGVFTAASLKGVMLHMYSHAMIKFVLFFVAGTIIQEFQTRNMMRIRGMMNDVPATATFWLTGILGILGLPPMGLFFSKFQILGAMFHEGRWLPGCLLLILLTGVLIGILYHGMRMLCDRTNIKPLGDLITVTDTFALMTLLLLTCVVGAGFENIPWLNNLLNHAVRIVGGC